MKLALILVAGAALAGAQAAPSGIPKIKYSDTRMETGLRVLIAEDHYAPLYAICVAYQVGSKDERKGRTGFAHLFEHMMFKGSENVAPGELDFLIFTKGGNSEDVARVASKYVPYDNVQGIAVGDGTRIRDLLEKFGPVEGKPVD